MMCCALRKSSLPVAPMCGMQISDRLFGGQLKELDDDGWTALIEYQKPDGGYGFHCGGSLINERYILTAAHCINAIPPGWKVHRVRLGEWDLESVHDCEHSFCVDPPIDLDIEQIIVHPEYEARNGTLINDIALIRFSRRVRYSVSVRPICLPLSASHRIENSIGQLGHVSGWGKTQTDTAHRKKAGTEMNIIAFSACHSFYKTQEIDLMKTHFCAGKIRPKDTCSGDSGGLLMKRFLGIWYLMGVDSFGAEECGSPKMPRVYTNVAMFVDWIRDNIV